MSEPSRAMGGVTPSEAKRIMQATLQTKFARKNLFLVQITRTPTQDMPEGSDWLTSKSTANLPLFNLFVTDLSYTGFSINAEQQRVGSQILDQPIGRDPFDLRITTLDNEQGQIKQWFSFLASRIARTDGTMRVPSEYLIKIKIMHGFVTEESKRHWLGGNGVQVHEHWYRMGSMEVDLSRKEDGFEELTIVLHRFDSFHK
jgi:hypothetical protein